MTRFYSPHYTNEVPSTTLAAIAPADPSIKAGGLKHMAVRRSWAVIDLALATLTDEDEFRMFTMKSSDRLGQLFITTPAAWAATTLTLDVGLWTSNDTHDGVELDADLYINGLDGTATLARTDHILQSTTLGDEDRWKPLWEQLALGAGTDTVDPVVDYDVVIHVDALTTVTVADKILLEAVYLPGAA